MPRFLELARRLRWWVLVPLLTLVSWAISMGLMHAFYAGDAKWDVWRHRSQAGWSWTPFIHPPGYNEFLRFVENLAAAQGTTETYIGLQLAGLCAAALVPLVAAVTAGELGRSGWVVGAAALVAISPSFLRPFEDYPLAILLVTASTAAMFAYARDGGLWRWVLVPVTVLLAVELHLNAWFLLGPAMAALLVVSRGRRLGFLAAIGVTVGVFLYSTVSPEPGMWALFDHPHAYFQDGRRFGSLRWDDANLEWLNPLLLAPLALYLVPAVARRSPRGAALAAALVFYSVVTAGLMASGLAIASNRAESHHYFELIDPALTIAAVLALATARRAALDAGRPRLPHALLAAAALLVAGQAALAADGARFLRTSAHSPWLWQGYSDVVRLDAGDMSGWIVMQPTSADVRELRRTVASLQFILSPDEPLVDRDGVVYAEGPLVEGWSIEERMGDPDVPELVLRRDCGGWETEWPRAAIAPGRNADKPFTLRVLGYSDVDGGRVVAEAPDVRHEPDPNRPGAPVILTIPGLESNAPTCGDGIDNDGDGWPDEQDPSCGRSTSGYERGALSAYPCNDGIDNDGDGTIDHRDGGCEDGFDDEGY